MHIRKRYRTQEEPLYKRLVGMGVKVKFNHLHREPLTLNRMTTGIAKDQQGRYYIEHSICSAGDQYSKQLGRVIVMGRLVKRIESESYTPHIKVPDNYKFIEDRIHDVQG